ncbi:MAG: hypothetical protein JWO84_695 [Parcubacteria group bacterium]|nr:hypothetical protein [Parcubacteria group bacterium]
MSAIQTALLVIAVSAVALGDIFLKETYKLGTYSKAITSSWMLLALALYLVQIALFTYLFVSGSKLFAVGIIQTALYAVIVLGASVFLFKESATLLQIAGIVLALAGVLLINL